MNTWKTQTISEFGKIVTGKTPPSERPDQFGEEHPFITPSDIKFGNKQTKTERFLSEQGLEAHKRIKLPKKSVCVVCIGATIGKVCATEQLSVSNQQINSIIVDAEKHDPDFVFYIASLLRNTLEAYAGGAATPIVNKSAFSKIKLQVPQRAIQRKIAAILTAYDDLIETNKRRIALLEKMAEELYREWFVRMRFPGHQNTNFVKGVPEGWEVKTINSFCKEVRKGVKKKDLVNDEIYVGLEHIPRKSIALKDWAAAGSVDSDKLRFNERDILFCKIRPYLHKVALAHVSGVCSSDTIVLRPREQSYEGFLLLTVFSETFIELATIASKGTKMPRADWAFLEKLELKIPPPALLKKFQSRFEELFSLISTLLESNRQAVSARDLLLPRLISGKLSVEDLNIQFPPSMAESSAPQPHS